MRGLNIGGIHIPVPVIQGGMGVGISLSGLAVAVANQGGVGVISAAGLGLVHRKSARDYLEANLEGLRYEIRKAKEKTQGVIGVNIMVAMTNFADLVRTAVQERVDIIFSGAGLPLDLPSFLKQDSVTRLVPIVSSGRAAKLICDKWQSAFNYLPDAIVVEGPKAGGHLGFKPKNIDDQEHTLEDLVRDVRTQVDLVEEKYGKKIPVIAAGGIYTGEDVFSIMQQGADAVQLGSRFVTTNECDASEAFKQAYLDATENDIEIISSPVGMPGRAIRNGFLDKVSKGLKQPVKCPFHCIRTCDISTTPYCIIQALFSAYKGNMNQGFAFAGTNAFRANAITSVSEIFDDLKAGFQKSLDDFRSR
jgi:nitronate monooxygenase